ncbi:MAG: hypothetical protein WCF64_11010, partial [Methylocella sp.]
MVRSIYSAADFLVLFVKAGRAPPRFARTRDRRDQNRANVWCRRDEFSQALQRIASLTAAHPRAVAVGSSMGGPAAIRFAVAVRPGGENAAIKGLAERSTNVYPSFTVCARSSRVRGA